LQKGIEGSAPLGGVLSGDTGQPSQPAADPMSASRFGLTGRQLCKGLASASTPQLTEQLGVSLEMFYSLQRGDASLDKVPAAAFEFAAQQIGVELLK
jgi:hypothetical protein